MATDVERLAVDGAGLLAEGAASTALWVPVRDGFAEWFRRHASTYRSFGDLAELSPNTPERQWYLKLLHVLVNAPRPVLAAAELVSLIDELTPYFAAGPHEPYSSQDHLDFRGSTFNGTVAAVQHNHYGTGTLHDPAGWSTVEAADPIGLGVRRTRRLDKDPELPAYVGRDIDERLRALVSGGGLVVVTGEPLSGKSRTAWAAVLGALSPKTRVHSPSPGADLRALPGVLRDRDGSYVLWLDDLDGHFGERGLDSALLAQLAELRVPVVATMNDEAYDARRFGGGPAARVLARAEPLELTCRWSEAELTRLARERDPRLADAREWRGKRGVTEYLAVGPELWDEWWRARRATAHPRGHVVVRVAADLARLGVDKGVSPDVLEELSAHYELFEGLDPERESRADAFAWATEVRHGVTGMLVEDGPRGELRAFGSLAADARRSSQTRKVPYGVWEAVRTLALDEGEGSAFHLRFAKAAAAYFMPHAAAGSPEALFRLGRYDHGLGTIDQEYCFRKAADEGHFRAAAALAELFVARGDTAGAEPYLEQAAEAGDAEAAATLGTLLRDRAETWLCQAAEAGDPAAAHELGDMLVGTGREDEALRWYRKAAAAGRREVAASLGTLLRSWRDPEADSWLRYAAAWGDARGAGEMGIQLSWVPGGDEAEMGRFFRQAADGGDANAARNLGVLLEESGRFEEAMARYHQALQGGVVDAEKSIGQLLYRQGETAEAEVWLRRAAIANPTGLPAALPPPPPQPEADPAPTPDTVKE
ncbi:sel1 repeat family protein [Streptomyces sp. NBC_00986]|uniref:sel1 repeat family protein n=1 Tax=Streptomyces sp. NBC_00986 TaxID=2903702 RepID=UPI003869E46D|nr:sel1 repeat family protein [Streptomyces sp. NBC_00986]